MSNPPRELRRCALLGFSDVSLNEQTIDRIAEQGFTDVGVSVSDCPEAPPAHGFSLSQARELAGIVHSRGLGMVVFRGYIKYQEPFVRTAPGRSMRTRGQAGPRPADGKVTRWLCPFRPENKAREIATLSELAKLPALRQMDLNDEASLCMAGGIGCYCDYCAAQFRERTGGEMPDPWARDDPLWWPWMEWRMASLNELNAELRAAVRAVRPDIDVGTQMSAYITTFHENPWKNAVDLARDGQTLDVLCTNIYHMTFGGFIDWRPHRRMLAEATRNLVGACIDTRVNLYPQGFMPLSTSAPMGRQDGLLAGIVPYALGADAITPYNYELTEIVPGFIEALQDADRLKEELACAQPYSHATVVYPFQSEIRGHRESDWCRSYLRPLSELMYRTGLPWRWFWDGRLVDAADRLAGPLIVPEAHCLTAPEQEAIAAVAERGEGVLWIGNTAREAFDGSGPCPLPAAFETGEFYVDLEGEHPLLADIHGSLILQSRVDWSGPEGEVIASVDGKPAVVLMETEGRRQAWLAGLPRYEPPSPFTNWPDLVRGAQEPSGGVDLLRRLLRWVAPKPPMARLEPFPPLTAYGKLRPTDGRNIPPLEPLPLVGDSHLLAIIFPYMPVATETSLVLCPPDGAAVASARELWKEQDLTDQIDRTNPHEIRLPLRIPGDCELLAIRIDFA